VILYTLKRVYYLIFYIKIKLKYNKKYLGEILPVDGLLFKSNNVSIDESSVTGETNLVRKGVPSTYE